MNQVVEIEKRIDREHANTMQVGNGKSIVLDSMQDVFECAKMMAVSGVAVPEHLRGNPGGCLAVCMDALQFGMPPFAVARQSYITKDGATLGYMAQLWMAVGLKLALPKGYSVTYEGEGGDRRCIISAVVAGHEGGPREMRSEPLKKLLPAMGQNGLKGSPLWAKKPDIQMAYNTLRDFIRVYCPGVMMGTYSDDELEETPAKKARDVTPKKIVSPFDDPVETAAATESENQVEVSTETAEVTTVEPELSANELITAIDVELSAVKTTEDFIAVGKLYSSDIARQDDETRAIIASMFDDREQIVMGPSE